MEKSNDFLSRMFDAEQEVPVTFDGNGFHDIRNNGPEIFLWVEEHKGYIPAELLISKSKIDPENMDYSLFEFFNQNTPVGTPFFKRTLRNSDHNLVKKDAKVMTWVSLAYEKAKQNTNLPMFDKSNLSENFLIEVAQMSSDKDQTVQIFSYLKKLGIQLVLVKNIPGADVDGFVTRTESGNPMVALSLRYKRLDNFWFTLLHELAHILLHMDKSNDFFIVDQIFGQEGEAVDMNLNEIEDEANFFAREAIIPRKIWNRSSVKQTKNKITIYELAEKLSIHPALVAGRLQWETKNYALYREIVDQIDVRELLGDYWE